jgi:serine protease AprX
MPRRTPALALALACATPGAAVPAGAAAVRQVVVTAPGGAAAAAAAVSRAGGVVLASLPLARGVVARLRQGAALPPSYVVAEDRALAVAGLRADAAGGSTVRATLGLPPTGTEGAGVTVAVVDTGVADVPELAGVVTRHVDVTGTGGGDAYGHGTFMAGLVAGRSTGVAPGADVLDVKVAGADGSTSLSLVLRGLEVVARDPDVDVLNLSLSSGSPLPWQLDPLTTALGALWRRGVVVVVPSGNDGPGAATVGSPGVDPTLLTVGAVDENGTAARGDDTVPAWSSRGPAPQHVAKPDLAAPGAHLVSLRAPGSAVDAANPDARVGTAFFRGSGTSMSTAVTAGAAAALLAARPRLTPDGVKQALTTSAYGAPGLSDADAAGAGGVDVAAAYGADATRSPRRHPAVEAAAFAAFVRAVVDDDLDAAARAWAGLGPGARAWVARAWAGAWPANSWSANSWSANSWSDEEWPARAWAGRAWAARAWAGRAWAGRAWADEVWDTRAWADDAWAGRAWAGRAWAAAAWGP